MSYTKNGPNLSPTQEDPDWDYVEVDHPSSGTKQVHAIPPAPWFADHKLLGTCFCSPRHSVDKKNGITVWVHRSTS